MFKTTQIKFYNSSTENKKAQRFKSFTRVLGKSFVDSIDGVLSEAKIFNKTPFLWPKEG
jgi:hypothetical protein